MDLFQVQIDKEKVEQRLAIETETRTTSSM